MRGLHKQKEGENMDNLFDVVPNSFFNPLASNSNYRINSALFRFIYEQYDNEISYRIKRNILRDELAYFISDNNEELIIDEDNTSKSCVLPICRRGKRMMMDIVVCMYIFN